MSPYAYVAANGDDALTIIDVTNPAVPVFVGSIQGAGAPPGGNWLDGAARPSIVGNRAYIAAGGDDALTIIDVTNPALPVFVGSIQGAGAPNFLDNAAGTYVQGIYAYVVSSIDDSLSIFNILNPALPVLVGSIQGAGVPPGGNWLNNPLTVQVIGNYAYIAASGDHSLTIIDVTNPAAPIFSGNIRGVGAPNFLSFIFQVHVIGNLAYCAADGDDALTIIDVTNPALPVFVGSIQGAGVPPGGNWLSRPVSVYVRGIYAYVTALWDDALTIIDVSNPALPVLAGSIQGAGPPNYLDGPVSVYVINNLAYVCARGGDDALTIIDVTNPALPVLVGSIQGAGAPPGGNWLGRPGGVRVPISAPIARTDPATEIT